MNHAVERGISLHFIFNNEGKYATRMLESFKDAFDEVCAVRACGSLKPDDTWEQIVAWCVERKVPLYIKEYRNEGWQEGQPFDLEVKDEEPGTWPHVDDFGAARNAAHRLCTQYWTLWADCDDLLADGSAETIRNCAARDDFHWWFFNYQDGPTRAKRERLMKRGSSQWQWPLHETQTAAGLWLKYDPTRGFTEQALWVHRAEGKDRRPNAARNHRILARKQHNAWVWDYYRAKDFLMQGDWARGEAFARLGLTNFAMEKDFRFDLVMTLAERAPSLQLAQQYAMMAFGLSPDRREPLHYLARIALDDKRPEDALAYAWTCGIKPNLSPHKQPFGYRPSVYQYEGSQIFAQAARASGNEELAKKNEDKLYEDCGGKITMVHATRGRALQALQCRDEWYRRAANPGGIEHIFAVDDDDKEVLGVMKQLGYKYVEVPAGGGCVRAWNVATHAAKGEVIVQVSDDFFPPYRWDESILARLGDTTKPKVLAVSDGIRQDGLLCIAIVTKARIKEQTGGLLFWKEYKSMYSDNEFSIRAYADNVVVEARDLVFEHKHPLAQGIPIEKWHPTTRESNSEENYKTGKEIFERRNQAQIKLMVERAAK